MLPVVILAGGLATRLRPITEKIPKALVPVAGKPFIYHQLAYLGKQGVDRVVLCIGYLGQMIQDVVGNGAEFGLSVSYSPDGPVLLGTGGALKQAVHLLDKSFFVLYGDSFLPINFSAVENSFLYSGKPALMTILHNGNRWDKSNVLFRNGRLEEYNKRSPRPEMEFIDYGLGVLSRSVFEQYHGGHPLDLADVYHSLSLEGNLFGYQVHERFYEIGSIPGLQETETYFLRQ
ncbi:nucleotidyltransferase family protein [Cylindrospermopsis raciborskii]|uniref:nucleotidyltransferase family protein n=1 Tax=Cylindrospermopsis raciborskii TaxID=77022 RepID=UPI0022C3F578|nr:nucleotidyltransferase family protein [Cylindrospermopsis raciborskii]MCZ2207543.1 nucleotidyltransferase family protein [Cylindrospermopsis raciborskii PAMP2011]